MNGSTPDERVGATTHHSPLAGPLTRVAVTGGTGFIGGHLVRALVDLGASPSILGRSSRQTSLLAGLEDRVRRVRMDLLDRDSVQATLEAEAPRTLFHLAGTRGRGAEDPTTACVELNILATLNVLNAAARAGVGRVVILGSADEYGNQPGPLHEGMVLQPSSPYAISLAAVTRLAQVLHEQSGCPVAILRPFTVYGPGQPADMFVAQAVESAVEERPFRMTHGMQRRDLVFVGDMVRALIAAGARPGIEGRVINVGTGQAHRLRDVAARIWELTGSKAPLLIGDRPAGPHETHDTWADLTLARELLHWSPETDLDTGLRAMVDWARTRAQEVV
jgi:nucleoside-diphosphate-sugar epimerase